MNVLGVIRQRSFARYVAFDLAEAARRLGWAVHWVDLDALAQQHAPSGPDALREALSNEAVRIRAFRPDVIFSYGLEAFVPPYPDTLPDDAWTIVDVAKASVACFFFDFGPPFDRPVDARTAPLVERLQGIDVRVFCWDRAALADLHRHGLAAEYFPMAVNDAMFFPPGDDAWRDVPIVFAGGPTSERIEVLRAVAPHGLEIYGYGEATWRAEPLLAPCYHGLAPERDRMRGAYQRAQLTVNVTRPHGRASLNMRVFEAMACGCVVVTDQAEEAGALFIPGTELVTAPSRDALPDVVSACLADPHRLARIGAAGAVSVRDGHTYVRRLAGIAPRLRTFVAEARAWTYWEGFVAEDPAKALRFTAALRAEQPLLREDQWVAADATAHARLGHRAEARHCLELARTHNPALLRLRTLIDRVGPA